MRDSRTLESVFLEHAPQGVAPRHEDQLLRSCEAGRRAWPGVEIPPAVFTRFLAERAGQGDQPGRAHDEDLYIACACAEGVSGAIDAVERGFGADLARVMARRGASASQADEAAQRLRVRLFAAAGGQRPKIAEYGGRAPLRIWLAAVASREVLMLLRESRRRGQREVMLEAAVEDARSEPDLEVGYLKARYKEHLEAAVQEAIERLTDKDRALLRLHFGNGFTVDRLAPLYQVGRSTAARWLASARGALREETRRALCRRLDISESEYGSLVRLVRSEVQVSAVRLLQAV